MERERMEKLKKKAEKEKAEKDKSDKIKGKLSYSLGDKLVIGFSGRMGNKIPAPRLLKLTLVDAHLAGADNKFHAGHFSWVTESGKQEKHLVATVGKFSVIWNFQQVKNSPHHCYQNQQGLKSCYCYKIVLKDESIIESRFMHDKFALGSSPEAPLVVATPMKVTSACLANDDRSLNKPSQDSGCWLSSFFFFFLMEFVHLLDLEFLV